MNQFYPWAFVGLICALAAMAPTVWRSCTNNRWRFRLSHFFVLPVIVALMAVSILHFRETTHQLDEIAHEWNCLWWPTSDQSPKSGNAIDAGVPYRSMPEILFTALKRAVIPATCTLSLSVIVNLLYAHYERAHSQRKPHNQDSGSELDTVQ